MLSYFSSAMQYASPLLELFFSSSNEAQPSLPIVEVGQRVFRQIPSSFETISASIRQYIPPFYNTPYSTTPPTMGQSRRVSPICLHPNWVNAHSAEMPAGNHVAEISGRERMAKQREKITWCMQEVVHGQRNMLTYLANLEHVHHNQEQLTKLLKKELERLVEKEWGDVLHPLQEVSTQAIVNRLADQAFQFAGRHIHQNPCYSLVGYHPERDSARSTPRQVIRGSPLLRNNSYCDREMVQTDSPAQPGRYTSSRSDPIGAGGNTSYCDREMVQTDPPVQPGRYTPSRSDPIRAGSNMSYCDREMVQTDPPAQPGRYTPSRSYPIRAGGNMSYCNRAMVQTDPPVQPGRYTPSRSYPIRAGGNTHTATYHRQAYAIDIPTSLLPVQLKEQLLFLLDNSACVGSSQSHRTSHLPQLREKLTTWLENAAQLHPERMQSLLATIEHLPAHARIDTLARLESLSHTHPMEEAACVQLLIRLGEHHRRFPEEQMMSRLAAIFSALEENSALWEEFTAVLREASASCVDRALYYFNQIEGQYTLHQLLNGDKKEDNKILHHIRGLLRQEKLHAIVTQIVADRAAQGDASAINEPLEIHLAYHVGLQKVLGLPGKTTRMHFSQCAAVNRQMVQEVAEKVLLAEQRDPQGLLDALTDHTVWQLYLRKQHQVAHDNDPAISAFAEKMEQLDAEHTLTTNKLHAYHRHGWLESEHLEQQLRMEEIQYTIQANALAHEREAASTAWYQERSLETVQRFLLSQAL